MQLQKAVIPVPNCPKLTDAGRRWNHGSGRRWRRERGRWNFPLLECSRYIGGEKKKKKNGKKESREKKNTSY